MAEPIRYCMATGLPVEQEIKSYPLKSTSTEKEFWNFIAEHEQARKDWHNKNKKNNEDHQKGNQT